LRFEARVAIDGQERLDRMRDNAKRAVARLEPQPERPGILAVVGYGPSLRETWPLLASYDHVCTTSGAHDFLIERGIKPRWHVEFDPRDHKCAFLTKPNPGTDYCLASVCHPKLYDQLGSASVLMWHAGGSDLAADASIVNAVEDDGIILYGGSTAGLRALIVGHVLGFRKFALFGLDCGYAEDAIWAGKHSGKKHHPLKVECNGRAFLTSDIMLNAASELWRCMFGEMAGSEYIIVGDHLFAERMKLAKKDHKQASGQWWTPIGWEPKEAWPKQIGKVITPTYKRLNAELHKINDHYGIRGDRHAPRIAELMQQLGTDDVLDYGCGKRGLEKALGKNISNYDPAIRGISCKPKPADIVVCTDVLEHVEPECLEAVLKQIARVTRRVAFFEVATCVASKVLPDGRNTHLIVRTKEWWLEKLRVYFDLDDEPRSPSNDAGPTYSFCLLAKPRGL
jgi:hypothetical protein